MLIIVELCVHYMCTAVSSQEAGLHKMSRRYSCMAIKHTLLLLVCRGKRMQMLVLLLMTLLMEPSTMSSQQGYLPLTP